MIADRPGGPEVLRLVTLPDPEPGPGQVRIAVEYAAITFVDTQIRSGSDIAPPAKFPVVLGNGVGGVVQILGRDVDESWLGARVVTTTGGSGGYASLALASASDLHRLPEGYDIAHATALLADGRTAVGLSHAATMQSGEVVVVSAAAGGVGSLLVQLAKEAGARVVALAGSDTKLDLARQLGADVGINYREPEWGFVLDEVARDGVDVVFDGVGGMVTETLLDRVRSGARYVQHGAAGGRWTPIDGEEGARRGIKPISLAEIGPTPDAMFQLTEKAIQLGAQGALRPTIGQRYPLADAAQAHRRIESRESIGKTLLRI